METIVQTTAVQPAAHPGRRTEDAAAPSDDARGQQLLVDDFIGRVEVRLDELLDAECRRWTVVDPELRHGFDALRAFIANGGKRLRPTFAFWGFVGAGGDPTDPLLVELAAALEMLHSFALIHDDVMDGSALRRHAPTVHCALAQEHEARAWAGEARRFGEGMAVLLGDLAIVYADHLASTLPMKVRACFHQMKVELHVGQYLDLRGAACGRADVASVTNVVHYKTAKYSVERPLHLGAALAEGATIDGREPQHQRLSTYGLAVGEAFQLRDDLLGAFGDPRATGKATGDDFRDGKQTLLIVLAREWLAAGHGDLRAASLLDRLGAPDLTQREVSELQDLLDACGARTQLEARIVELTAIAREVLPTLGVTDRAEAALARLADHAAWRCR